MQAEIIAVGSELLLGQIVDTNSAFIAREFVDLMEKGKNPTVGTLAHLGQVDIRIAAKGADAADASRMIEAVEAEIRQRLGDIVFGVDEDTLEGQITARLRAGGARVAVAELGSAGAGAERLATGAAEGFAGGVILVRRDEARRLAGDADATGSAQERAERLAEAVRKWSGVEIGLATVFEDVPDTTPPVTVVGIAVARGGRRVGREHRLGGDRPSLRIRTATLALDLLRRSLS